MFNVSIKINFFLRNMTEVTKCKFKKVNNWTTTTYTPRGAFDYTTNGVTMHAHSCMTPADKDQLIWVKS